MLAFYATEQGPQLASPEALAYAVKALSPFRGGVTCETIKGATCRAYVRERAKPKIGKDGRARTAGNATARRELGVLQAALNYAVKEGRLVSAPLVTLPEQGHARDRWLTREEAAALLRAASPHLQRFILIALTSGRRASAILGLQWSVSLDSGYVDGDVLHFRGARERETKKRRGSIWLPIRLAGHIRRWRRTGGSHVVMWKGKPCKEVDTAFKAACTRAGLEGVTPHTLKHTAVTWAFQKGITVEDAADWFDTTPQTLLRHYKAHSPHYQKRAHEIMERK